jgi:hypothetical protein
VQRRDARTIWPADRRHPVFLKRQDVSSIRDTQSKHLRDPNHHSSPSSGYCFPIPLMERCDAVRAESHFVIVGIVSSHTLRHRPVVSHLIERAIPIITVSLYRAAIGGIGSPTRSWSESAQSRTNHTSLSMARPDAFRHSFVPHFVVIGPPIGDASFFMVDGPHNNQKATHKSSLTHPVCTFEHSHFAPNRTATNRIKHNNDDETLYQGNLLLPGGLFRHSLFVGDTFDRRRRAGDGR